MERFRGAAYIVARMCTPGMQQGRLWICSLLPDSHHVAVGGTTELYKTPCYAKSTTMPVDGKSLMALLDVTTCSSE
jgi:hypothetical protein